jgi:hypothetical protein
MAKAPGPPLATACSTFFRGIGPTNHGCVKMPPAKCSGYKSDAPKQNKTNVLKPAPPKPPTHTKQTLFFFFFCRQQYIRLHASVTTLVAQDGPMETKKDQCSGGAEVALTSFSMPITLIIIIDLVPVLSHVHK